MKSLAKAKAQFRSTFLIIAGFSFVVNILMLTMPLYMLQIYDRILPSRSLDTLTFLSIIALGALLVLGLLEAVRGILAARAAARLETNLGADAMRVSMILGAHGSSDVQPVRDLAAVRHFISSRAIFALMDMPFAPMFIGLLYLIHPSIFWLTLAGAVVLLLLAVLTQYLTSDKASLAQGKQGTAMGAANAMSENAETLRAMGMIDNGIQSWGRHNAESMIAQGSVDTRNALLSGFSRTIRLLLQIAILGLGAWLVLQNEMTPGMIFAASIISSRGLQPLDQVIGAWKQMVTTRRSWTHLSKLLARLPETIDRTQMEKPKGEISLESVSVAPPRGVAGDPILNRVELVIEPGTIVGVVGPSGSGKSTLARLLVGAQGADSGQIRIDGTDIKNWDPNQLGRDIGYLSQEVRLFPGTIKENIARLSMQPDDAAVLEAARKAQVHGLIQSLPHGYDTLVGPNGYKPSVGQRQRIALARVFYGNPQIMVLDEPNANLDDDGELALRRALAEARKAGTTVVVITQRKQILNDVDKILRLHRGKVDFFGTTKEFVMAIKSAQQRAQQAAGVQVAQAPAPKKPKKPRK